jgi:hypothetical protein
MIVLPEHELKVIYPHGGKHYLLHWYEHWEGNHLIIGRSIASVDKTFQRVLDKHIVEIKAFLQVNIVAPSEEQCKKHAKAALQSDVQLFWEIFVDRALDYHKETGKLPSKLKWCQNYSDKWVDEESLPDPEKEKEHYSCSNCNRRIAPADGIDIEEIYLLNREKYLAKYNSMAHQGAATVKSLALLPDTSLLTYVISSDFGHHSPGLIIGKNADDLLHFERVMFFYQSPQSLDYSQFEASCKAKEEAIEREQKELKRENEVRRKAYREESFRELLEFFD